MPLPLLKSVLSIGILALTFLSMFTMFEILGRAEKRYDLETLKKTHRVAGILFFLLFIVVAYFCLRYLIASKSELSPRSAFHSTFALAVFILFCLKVSFVRLYRQFYGKVQMIGLLISLLTFGMVGTSAGYYLAVTKFGQDETFRKVMDTRKADTSGQWERRTHGSKIAVKTGPEGIARGKALFGTRCSFCHDPLSTKTIVGPGLAGVLKHPSLPASGRPATPDNVEAQLRHPFDRMPSFAYLSEGEVSDLISYLNTL